MRGYVQVDKGWRKERTAGRMGEEKEEQERYVCCNILLLVHGSNFDFEQVKERRKFRGTTMMPAMKITMKTRK
jgi:hypothetical protein